MFFFPQIKVAYKKDAKENLHYTTVADRPDIKKATQAAKQASEVRVSLKWPGTEGPLWTRTGCVPLRPHFPFLFSLTQVEYRAKHRKEGSHGLSMLGRPDIEMAKKAAKLSSQVIENDKQWPWCGIFQNYSVRRDSQKEQYQWPRRRGLLIWTVAFKPCIRPWLFPANQLMLSSFPHLHLQVCI